MGKFITSLILAAFISNAAFSGVNVVQYCIEKGEKVNISLSCVGDTQKDCCDEPEKAESIDLISNASCSNCYDGKFETENQEAVRCVSQLDEYVSPSISINVLRSDIHVYCDVEFVPSRAPPYPLNNASEHYLKTIVFRI